MQLKPDDRWQWYFDSQHDRLMLDLTDGLIFRSIFNRKILIPDAFNHQPFSVNDAALFQDFDENCRALPLNSEQHATLVLNAIVASRFLKPQLPKSWHFSLDNQGWLPKQSRLVETILSDTQQSVILLVVEAGEKASQCILAQPYLQLNSSKTLLLGEVIKVMNDRLRPYAKLHQQCYEQAV